jgi:hypothetical protein
VGRRIPEDNLQKHSHFLSVTIKLCSIYHMWQILS